LGAGTLSLMFNYARTEDEGGSASIGGASGRAMSPSWAGSGVNTMLSWAAPALFWRLSVPRWFSALKVSESNPHNRRTQLRLAGTHIAKSNEMFSLSPIPMSQDAFRSLQAFLLSNLLPFEDLDPSYLYSAGSGTRHLAGATHPAEPGALMALLCRDRWFSSSSSSRSSSSSSSEGEEDEEEEKDAAEKEKPGTSEDDQKGKEGGDAAAEKKEGGETEDQVASAAQRETKMEAAGGDEGDEEKGREGPAAAAAAVEEEKVDTVATTSIVAAVEDGDDDARASAVATTTGEAGGSDSTEDTAAALQQQPLKVETKFQQLQRQQLEKSARQEVIETVEDVHWYCIGNVNWMGVGRRIILSHTAPQ
jgi:hypothetical protein